MKYFIDTHDKNKGSFPTQELTKEQFFEQFDALEEAATQFGVFGHAAHVNLPYDSITEVRRLTGADIRIPQPVEERKRKAG